MRIRTKLLLASAIPITLFVVQIVVVGLLVRELQRAVLFIASAQTTIESNLEASSQVNELKKQIKRLPSLHSNPHQFSVNLNGPWEGLTTELEKTLISDVTPSITADTTINLRARYENTTNEFKKTFSLLNSDSVNLDSLIERAIFTNDSLSKLDESLQLLTVELRELLQSAVDKEKSIHNLPLIAGVLIGGLAVAISVILVWRYVDSGISKRLAELSSSMLSIAGGNLKASIPAIRPTPDEIDEMNGALAIFRDNALEIEQSNIRENEQARQKRQYWLEHMASFLRHELKNKQVGAEQSINLLLSKQRENSEVRKYCDRANRSLMDMKELINSTVHATDIESALLAEQFSRIQVDEFLAGYVETVRFQGIENVIYRPRAPHACYMVGDRQRLTQMLDKIVANANDFRLPGTAILIGSELSRQRLFVSITNQGPKLPEDTRTLFDLSVTVRDAERNRQGNVGFGLFVALRIADYHGGGITADSTENGAVFMVQLPAFLPESVPA